MSHTRGAGALFDACAPALFVILWSSGFIGAKLGVECVLEGSVRTAADRLRVSARLTTVADGFLRWSKTFDGHLGDIFAVYVRPRFRGSPEEFAAQSDLILTLVWILYSGLVAAIARRKAGLAIKCAE